MTCLPPAAFFSCNVSFCRPSLLSCLSPFILFLVCFTLCLFPAFPLPAVSLAHYSLWCTLQCNFPSISVSLLTCLSLLLRLFPALSLSDVSLLPCPPIGPSSPSLRPSTYSHKRISRVLKQLLLYFTPMQLLLYRCLSHDLFLSCRVSLLLCLSTSVPLH